jgi:malonate decarboxylase beta subunit
MTAPAGWRQLLARRSFLEHDARARADALLDPGSAKMLCGPFDHLESPWLEPQGIVPQSDDGVVVALGAIDGHPAVVISIEQRFQGGATGEVSGAKISQAMRLAAASSRAGTPTAAVLLLETGGVRLQEANLGLNAVAEICAAVLELRPLAPVIGVVAGETGCFGGNAIVAGLCTRLIVTPHGRIGLNGPAVIEEEAGPAEFDAADRALIWAVHGGEQRHATGLADTLVTDDADALRDAVRDAVAAGPGRPGTHRSERLDVLASRLASLDPAHPPAPGALRELWGMEYAPVGQVPAPPAPRADAAKSAASRGRTWLAALGGEPVPVIGSVLRADTADTRYLAVVPDPDNPFHRARAGEVGLAESLALAQAIRQVIAEDTHGRQRRAIVAIVDLPSQAYGRTEEMAGLHQAIAATVDAYAAARTAGHPVVALVVGTAMSGGFLAHGLQAGKLLALDDAGVQIHAMHKPAAARITKRSPAQLDTLAETVIPLSYRVRDWARLGFCDGLLPVKDAASPAAQDIAAVRTALDTAIEAARSGQRDISARLDSPAAITTRAASREVRDVMTRQWTA